jgi:acyl carrier protein phosphodiesterase
MRMLTDDDWEPLRAAVPSFAERWSAFVAQPWYESDPSYTVSEFARHLVDEVVSGRTGELPSFFAALDTLLAGANDELYDLATIGLLEDVVHEADERGVKLTAFERAARGPHARKAWSAVVKFLRGESRSP